MILKPLHTDVSNHSLVATTLDNVKDNLKITDCEEDTLLSEHIIGSTDRLERWLDMQFLFGDNVSYYAYCSACVAGFVIPSRPLHVISEVAYLSSGSYVALVEGTDYLIQKERLQTIVYLKSTLIVDSPSVDSIRITYVLGFARTIAYDSLVFADPTLTITSSNPHGLLTGDPVYASGTTQSEYNGIFTIKVESPTVFTYDVIGSPVDPTGTTVIAGPDVPELLQIAIKRMVAAMYSNRGDCSDKCGEVPCGVKSLARSYRKIVIRTSGYGYGCRC